MPISVGKPIEINGITYDVKKIIGVGGLSTVFLAIDISNRDKVAIKSFTYQNFYDSHSKINDCEEYFENEVENTKAQARSGLNCVKVLGSEKKMDLQTPEFYIVLSFIEGETFKDWYRNFVLEYQGLRNLDLTSIVRYIFIPLAKILHYCHTEENIVHRDFSVSNIIIQHDKLKFWPVLIDWGVSKYIGPDWVDYCPKPYMSDEMPEDIPIKQKGAPPEVRNGYMPIPASDVYYLAHLMYFVFTGGIMREDSELTSHAAYVLDPKQANFYLPDKYNDLVKQMSQFEPADRPTSMKDVISLLSDLIKIQQIHFDFEQIEFLADTNALTGKKIKTENSDLPPPPSKFKKGASDENNDMTDVSDTVIEKEKEVKEEKKEKSEEEKLDDALSEIL